MGPQSIREDSSKKSEFIAFNKMPLRRIEFRFILQAVVAAPLSLDADISECLVTDA
jgi:hypothetical protein